MIHSDKLRQWLIETLPNVEIINVSGSYDNHSKVVVETDEYGNKQIGTVNRPATVSVYIAGYVENKDPTKRAVFRIPEVMLEFVELYRMDRSGTQLQLNLFFMTEAVYHKTIGIAC